MSSNQNTRTFARRVLGGLLLALSFLPIYRLLDTTVEAPFRVASVEIAEVTLQLAWWGTLSTLLVGVLLAALLKDGPLRAVSRRVGDLLCAPKLPVFATAMSVLAAALALLTWRYLYLGLFTNVDEIASTIQARYMAAGSLAGVLPVVPEAWLIPNTLLVDQGWVSQYPPTHLAFLALFIAMDTPWLVGAVSLGAIAGLVALSLPRLLPDRPATARLAALLVAVSPFLVFLGGGALSHLSAGALGSLVLYSALRARDGRASWGVLTGAAIGAMVSSRPLIGLILGGLFTLGIWVPKAASAAADHSNDGMGPSSPWLLRRAAATLIGGAPFAVLLGWFNYRLFGGITTFGYLAAFGSDHGLGFHRDPWGYPYGLTEAIGFTSTDTLAVGVQFLETSIPLTALVGLYLLIAPRLPKGVPLLIAWALLPVVGNLVYWFHATRMLFEAAPAWIALAALGAVELSRRTSDDTPLAGGLRNVAAWSFVAALAAAPALGIPTRWSTYSWTDESLSRITVPETPEPGPAIIFTHSSWNERISATLQGAGGMRQDSVISALRRNTNCALHRFAEAREAVVRRRESDVELPPVDLQQASGIPSEIERRSPAPGTTVRVRPGEVLTPSCVRELRSDRFGAVALAPLLWQGDLPGLGGSGILFVRDLGPEKNALILGAFPGRNAYVFVPKALEAPPELVDYAEAMAVLWGAPIESQE
ncbi:MAG: hypothetical protein BMS9Abin29_0115 [Gemmatimonadota bacterium]|nr:MAG: hypothetical protein BMS9Abin29_0115 [Gemmatimonadota bacterium]